MKEIRQEVILQEVKASELSVLDRELMNRAVEAAKNAYAPYSNFHVGAALLLNNGKIITGNNQENAAYPSGLCAERVAVFYAASQYPEAAVLSLAIAATDKKGVLKEWISPCGACRQVLLEVEARGRKPMRVLLCGGKTTRIAPSAKVLLPFAFDEDSLTD